VEELQVPLRHLRLHWCGRSCLQAGALGDDDLVRLDRLRDGLGLGLRLGFLQVC
jgi:hypothetical protein